MEPIMTKNETPSNGSVSPFPTVASLPAPSNPSVVGPTHDIPESVDPMLVTILSWPRAHGSYTELQFCKWLRETLTADGLVPVIRAEGCVSVTVPRPLPAVGPARGSTTLFSCHIDTVDSSVTLTPGAPDRKKLTYDPNFGHITLDKDSIGSSLGADDGAGVWLMLKMIERRVPGTYLFHRGEECGGIGSKAMAAKEASWLGMFECAVAFDRAGTSEVITHQRGGTRCASDKFGKALANKLTEKGMSYDISTRGSFTDTYEYRTIIPECVNVAVGYEDQHSTREMLDFAHLNALLDAVCAIDWDSLPIDRDPKVVEQMAWGNRGGFGHGWSGAGHRGGFSDEARGLFDEDDDFGFPGGSTKGKGGKPQAKPTTPKPTTPKAPANPFPKITEDLTTMSYSDLLSYLVSEDSETVANDIIALRLRLAAAEAECDEMRTIFEL